MIRPVQLLLTTQFLGCHLHPSNNDGGAINLAASGNAVFVARGERGIEVVDSAGATVIAEISPSGESDSYDDVSFADGILFALDADDGYLSTFAFTDNLVAKVIDVSVDVGPYSGVSAGGSFVAVSGGTSELSLLSYASDGSVTPVGTLAGHRGHPDIAVHPAGFALVSTHFSDEVDGEDFGIVRASFEPLSFTHEVAVPGAGFTDGGGTPANFPLRVALFGDHALAAHGGGITVMRVSDGLQVVSSLELGFEAVDASVADGRGYVVGSSQLAEIDLADVERPVLLRTFNVGGFAVIVAGDRVFVAGGEAALQIVDL